jgi:hypothetical protein
MPAAPRFTCSKPLLSQGRPLIFYIRLGASVVLSARARSLGGLAGSQYTDQGRRLFAASYSLILIVVRAAELTQVSEASERSGRKPID